MLARLNAPVVLPLWCAVLLVATGFVGIVQDEGWRGVAIFAATILVLLALRLTRA